MPFLVKYKDTDILNDQENQKAGQDASHSQSCLKHASHSTDGSKALHLPEEIAWLYNGTRHGQQNNSASFNSCGF
jgi:hypothetical protein